jgi:hypothetical protein
MSLASYFVALEIANKKRYNAKVNGPVLADTPCCPGGEKMVFDNLAPRS